MGSYALQSGEYGEDGELETLDEDEVEDTSDDNDEQSDEEEEEDDSGVTYEHPGRHPFPTALERWTTGSFLFVILMQV